MSTTTLTVTGMTCGRCATSVRDEIGRIPGIAAITVDLADRRVTFEGTGPVERGDLTAAVVQAGYSVAD
ncbi:heavy-metal-associated domain-containing protein [Nocardia sp. NBC_01730]|uniref:heavy-metal-associated domain-containing protein n=1 Tax=Nocardia sp. NBC_01730 TaxID=2975998 RepID=UPI002E131913|nr:heavy-metal-associated domain-containing protein [Nocardia sp. NBC_01730]